MQYDSFVMNQKKMEDYTKFDINGYKSNKNNSPLQKYRYTYDSNNIKLLSKQAIHWRQNNNTKNTRNSQQSSKSKKSIQDQLLKLNSKHTSVVGKNQNRSKTLSDYILDQVKIDHQKINKMVEQHHKSIVNDQVNEQVAKLIDKIIKENSKEQVNSKNKNIYQYQITDDREQKILLNKKKTNIKMLMTQVKQLLKLTQAQILQQERKILKSKVMQAEIQVRRLKISMRTKQNKKNNVIQQYYVQQNQSKYQKSKQYSTKRSTSKSGSGTRAPCSQYFTQQFKSEFYQERSLLLMARVKNIKEQIKIQKQDHEQKQRLIKQQIQLLKKENYKYLEAADRASVCVSQLSSRLSILAINSKINKVDFNSPIMSRTKKSHSQSQYKTSMIRPIRVKNYLSKK